MDFASRGGCGVLALKFDDVVHDDSYFSEMEEDLERLRLDAASIVASERFQGTQDSMRVEHLKKSLTPPSSPIH